MSMALAWAAAAWITGIVAAALFGASAWPLALALGASLLALALVRGDARVLVWAAVLPAIFSAAMLRFAAVDTSLARDDVATLAGGPDMRVRGVVRDDADIADTSQRFTVDVRDLQRAGAWQPASGGVRVATSLLPRLQSGDVVELEGPIETPSQDGGFDYADYLVRRGVRSEMAFPSIRVVGHDHGNPLREATLWTRRRLTRAINLALPEPQASLARGVLLGQRAALPADLSENLNATNTSHLVVVSGANVVLVAAFATGMLTRLVGRRRALVLSAAAVFAYMLLVGVSAPVVRGTIMGLLLVLAQATGRRTNGLASIAFAAALMLGLDPRAIRDVSFQLSFAATAGIVLLSPTLHDRILVAVAFALRRERVPGAVSTWVAVPLATTLAAIIATQPLLALRFGRVSLVALPANMLVVPVFPYILAGSAVAAAAGLVPGLRLLVAAPAYYLLSYWIAMTDALASFPFASLTVSGFSAPWAALTYAMLAAIAVALRRWFRGEPTQRLSEHTEWGKIISFASVGVPVAALVLSAGLVLQPDGPRVVEVTILDVGQGDAILIETPSGRDILIDGGPGGSVLRGLGSELPWYERSIELMVLTHPQADHLMGLLDVLDRYQVERAIVGGSEAEAYGLRDLRDLLRIEGVAPEPAPAGTAFDLGEGIRLEVIGPPAGYRSPQTNNESLVVRLEVGDVAFLFTGDIEAEAEAALIASGVDLRATVLKVPHHGSKTSSSQAFLDAVRPQVAVISAGKDNQFGHPNPEVVNRLAASSMVLTTADAGAVHFETDGARLWVSPERE
jgi:competence protein ComEC